MLKPLRKEIIELYYFKNKKYEEISEMLNIPIGTVKSSLYKAKISLRDKLSILHSTDSEDFPEI